MSYREVLDIIHEQLLFSSLYSVLSKEMGKDAIRDQTVELLR